MGLGMGLVIGLGSGFEYFRQYNVIRRIEIRRNGIRRIGIRRNGAEPSQLDDRHGRHQAPKIGCTE